jgi:hypothetical protein
MPTWTYLFEHPGVDPEHDRFVVDRGGQRTILVGVPAAGDAPAVARDLVRDEGVTLVELCGGFTTADVARVVDEVGPDVGVGYVMFPVEAVHAAARYGDSFSST